MQQSLLEKTRKINRIVQNKNQGSTDFLKLCSVLGDAIDANVYIINAKADIISKYSTPFMRKEINIAEDEKVFTKMQNFFWSFIDTRANLKVSEISQIIGLSIDNISETEEIFCTVVPIIAGSERLGTIFGVKYKSEFLEDDILLMEYVSIIVGLELLNLLTEENEEEKKKKEMVQSALETLSLSELEAIMHIFDELKGNEGLLVASKIADKVGITRSVIVNALRKFESAGLIETRSLGLKGTYIKVLNDMLKSELARYKERMKMN